jgi:predicted nucleotidyltransferase
MRVEGIAENVERKIGRIVDGVVRGLGEEPWTLGVLFYGSVVAGRAHRDSDLDFLCITAADWYSKEIRQVEGVEVEIQRIPETRVREELGFTSATNNNFMLNALTDGRILLDLDGRVALLVEEARRIWEAGPPPPGDLEVQMGATYFRHKLAEIVRLIEDGDPQRMLRVLADLLFFNSLYSFCRTHRRWGLKLNHMMEAIAGYDPAFHTLCAAYLQAETPGEMLHCLEAIAEAVMAPVGWASPTYETPRTSAALVGRLAAGFA